MGTKHKSEKKFQLCSLNEPKVPLKNSCHLAPPPPPPKKKKNKNKQKWMDGRTDGRTKNLIKTVILLALQLTIGFGFSSVWLKKWHIFFTVIVVKQNQMQITVNTQNFQNLH